MRLGVAEADPLPQRLARGEGYTRVLRIEGVRDVVTDPLEGGFGEPDIVHVGSPKLRRERPDLRGSDIDDVVPREVTTRVFGDEVHRE